MMANELKMAIVQAIERLSALRWSRRRIARELGIDRGTVSRYLQSLPADSKPAIPPTGGPASKAATFAGLPAPSSAESDDHDLAAWGPISKPAISPAGLGTKNRPFESVSIRSDAGSCERAQRNASAGRPSQCQAYGEVILAKLEQRLSAQRIWQDLAAEHGFPGSYDSVKRFVRRLGHTSATAFRRMERVAGEEAQVDFGAGAPVLTPDGKRRKTHVFRIVLSHSRKAYSEATFTQTTDDFLRALENAIAHFGGVTQTLVIDNLKAAVSHPDWFDPELTPKVQSFCRHYGAVILPTKPYMPRHKGKVEAGVKYVKNNALRGRVFESLEAQNRFLLAWETNVADKRIRGTTKRQVGKVFDEAERAALLPRPIERFALFHEAQRKVSRDGHVEVAKAYYSVPTEYLARTVWVRWDGRLVRIFNRRFEQIALHVRQERGRFSTLADHVTPEKISGVERGAAYLLGKVQGIGPQAHQWAEAMLTVRGIEGTRVLQGLLSLGKKCTAESLEKACEIALSHGAFRLRTLRKLVDRNAAQQQPLPFLEEHPIIRPLDDYAAIVARAIHRRADRSSLSEGFTRHGSGVRDGIQKDSPEGANHRGCDLRSTRPRSSYPLSDHASHGARSSAEPDAVSPDHSSIVPTSSIHQEF